MHEDFERRDQQSEESNDRESRDREAEPADREPKRANDRPHLTPREREERWPIG